MSFRSAVIRPAAFLTAALTAGALFAVGLGSAADAVTPPPAVSLTVHVETAAGLPATDAQIAFLPTADNYVDFTDLLDGQDAVTGVPVKSHPGTFTVALASAGQYTALLLDGHSDGESAQWLGGAPLSFPDGAQYLSIPAGASTLDVSYATSGSLSGTVKNASGKAVSGICVNPWAFDGADWYPSSIFGGCATYTNSKGQYSFNPHSAGSYKLEFIDPDGRYLDQFDGGATSEDDATPIYLPATKSAVVNTTLALGGTLSGTVTGYDHTTSDVDLTVFKLTGTPGAFTSDEAITDGSATSSGKFSIGGLPTGYYSIAYDLYNEDTDEETTGFLGGADALSATAFSVTAGRSTATGTLAITPIAPPTGDGEVDLTVQYNGVSLPGQAGGAGGDYLTLYASSDGTEYYPQDAASSATTYQFTDLPAGDYQAFVSESGYLPVEVDISVSAEGTSSQTIQLQLDSTLAFATPSTFSDPAVVGQPLTVAPGALNRPDAESFYAYQWYRDVDGSKQVIRGAQSATYTPVGGDVDDELFVRVTGEFVVGTGFTGQYVGAVTQMVSAGSVAASTAVITSSIPPELAGTPAVGATLGVDGGAWSQTGSKLSYQWQLDGEDIPGATSAHFTPAADQLGDTLAVTVTASKVGFPTSAPVTTDAEVIVAGAVPTAVTAPKVTVGSSHGIRSFVVTPARWSLAGGTTTYTWTVDGVAIAGSSPKFSTRSTDAIALTVDYSVPGHTSASWSRFVSRGTLESSTASVFAINVGLSDSFQVNPGGTVPVGYSLIGAPATTVLPDGTQFSSTSVLLQQRVGKAWKSVKTFTTHDIFGPGLAASLVGKPLRFEVIGTSDHYATLTMTGFTFTVVKNDALQGVGTATIPSQLPEGSAATVALGGFPAATSHSYQWQSSADDGDTWTPIAGAKSASYVLPSTAVGTEVRVAVTSVNASSVPETIDSGALAVLDNTIGNTVVPKLSATGPLRVGATVSVSTGTWDVAKTGYHYQWQSSTNGTDFTDIAGATSSAYKAATPDAGTTVRALVTASRTGYTSASAASNGIEIDAVPGDRIVVHPTPVTGGAYPGSAVAPAPTDVFTSVNGLAGAAVKYQWKVNGKTVTGAAGTGSMFGVRLADIGKKVQVTETLSSGVYGTASYTTPALTLQKGTLPFTLAEVNGTATAGNTVTSLVGNQVPATIQWRVSSNGTDWTAITGATHSSFAIPAADAGLTLDFVAKSTAAGYNVITITSFPISIGFQGTIAATNAPSISAPQVGVPTTVDTGDWTTTGLTLTYQWHNGDSAIPGATGATFTPLGSDAGDDLWVTVSAARAGWHSGSASSDVDTIARGAQLAIHTKPLISGSPTTCGTLSVSTGSWSVSGVSVTYQWFDGDTLLSGATSSTYQVSPGELGSQLSVQLTASAIGYQDGSFTTARTAAIRAGSTSCAP